MRNLTQEQADEIAHGVVEDHLRSGVEYLDVVEAVDDFSEDDEDEPTDEDYQAVNAEVGRLLARLEAHFAEQN